MSRPVFTKAFVRRVPADVVVRLQLLIGEAQSGEWKVWLDSNVLRTDTATKIEFDLGRASDLYNHVIQVEVRCDDTNPATDRLAARIALAPASLDIDWQTNNDGDQSPHGMMTSIAEIILLPVLP